MKMIGDGLHAVFDDPACAMAATVDLQRGMGAIGADCGIPLKMRCGLHAGIAEERDSDYFGSTVNRAARIMGAAHGGQVLLSQAVVNLAMEGFSPPARTFCTLAVCDCATSRPPRTCGNWFTPICRAPFRRALARLDANNLPQQLTSFIGREKRWPR